MSTKEEKSHESHIQKCPRFFNILNINDSIRPKVFIGIRTIINRNISGGFNASSSSNVFLTSKLVLNKIDLSRLRLGVLYLKNNDVQGLLD